MLPPSRFVCDWRVDRCAAPQKHVFTALQVVSFRSPNPFYIPADLNMRLWGSSNLNWPHGYTSSRVNAPGVHVCRRFSTVLQWLEPSAALQRTSRRRGPSGLRRCRWSSRPCRWPASASWVARHGEKKMAHLQETYHTTAQHVHVDVPIHNHEQDLHGPCMSAIR